MNKIKMYPLWLFLLLILHAGCEEVFETSLEGRTVQLLGPGNNVTTDSPVNFNWELIAEAENYRLQIVSPSFDSIELSILDTVTSKNFLTLPLDSGIYQWRVGAFNSSSISESSESRSLRIR